MIVGICCFGINRLVYYEPEEMESGMGADYVALVEKSDSEFIRMSRNVYAQLTDDISKKIFEARSMYALTGEVGAMTGLGAKYRNASSDIESYAEKIGSGMHVLIYGAGGAAHYLAGRFMRFGAIIDAFIEPDESKGNRDALTGIRIITEQELIDNRAIYGSSNVIISYSVKSVADETKKRLIERAGIAEENIAMGAYDWRNNSSQYFDYFEPGDNEVFVDCGCFDGGSCFRFAGWCGHRGYDHIYSFEADPANYGKCKAVLENLGKCELYPYGTAGERGKVYFESKAFEDSRIISKEEAESMDFKGVDMIETVALDEVLEGKRVTFIKMDVEGAEYEALLGAQKLIRENHPRMAISIYHKPEDYITLPNLVLEMNPDYRITFRHYGLDDLETIMYVE